MNNKVKTIFLVFLIVLSTSIFELAAGDTILAVQVNGPGRMQKSINNASIRAGIESRNLEALNYRNFTILLNPVANNTYEVQAYRMVSYGSHQVSSVFSSVYKSSIEYGYRFDQQNQRIVQYHFVFPPNSLTGWANPRDFSAMQSFDWGEKFPIHSCSQDTPIHTLEESGREYMEAACMPDRDTALRFARSFIDYMLGSRGM